MIPREDSVASYGARTEFRASKLLLAVLIVFVMIATPFAAVAGDVTEPTIWASKDQYVPDEVVTIYGEGWQKYVYVTLEFEHPDFLEALVFEDIMVDLYGRFAFDGYVSESLIHWETPVTVTATQYFNEEVLTATTWFQDPAAYLQGYTINPVERWTTGDIKGYNEGDSVPFQAVLNKAQLGVDTVSMTIGVDYQDLNPTEPPYGVDYLTQYWLDPPLPPYNTYPASSEPFGVLASEGTITYQEQLPDQIDEGTNQIIQVWTFTFTFAPTAKVAHIMFGAHMALTTGPHHLGASYYPGSSLHVRIVEMTPSEVSDEGNRDVPIALGQLLMPPEMVLEKWVEPAAEPDPQDFLPGETITFTIHWTNIGQAQATCVELWDSLDPVATIIPGSFYLIVGDDPPVSITPVVLTDTYFELSVAYWPGTGEMGTEFPPLDGYLQFQAVISPDAMPGTYYNNVWMTYTDDHGGLFPTLHAQAPFRIPNEPAIMIEKTGVELAHVGDTVTYEYLVTNIGDVPLHNVVVIDDVVGVVDLGTFDGTLEPGESVTLYMDYIIGAMDPDPLKNIATVTGDDNYGRTVTDDDDHMIDILKPSVDITKTADMECAKPGELVTYTIRYENTAVDGETDLYDVVVSDTLLGVYNIGFLAAGAWGEIIETIPAYEVTSDPDGEMPNYVTIVGR
ncbi:MAG: hypothetical protein MUC90_06485, partial [Thermoplasmata archaeon]|nr:hypothetical protein [Thermoplasmata archaeon]